MPDSILALAAANTIFDICLNGDHKQSPEPSSEVAEVTSQDKLATGEDHKNENPIKIEAV